ncbi:MAG: cation diffusion facilitator family transporter, partial [Methylophaga nitratireducenticrescens]
SMMATVGLLLLQRFVIKKTKSSAIRADSLHYQSDLLVNFSVIIALLLTQFGLIWFDPLMAVFIAVYVLFSAWKILRDAVDLLMDHEISDAERQQITELVLKHPQVKGMHDLRTRRSGTTVFIQLHLELDAAFTLQQAHDISDQVNQEIHTLFDEAEVIIHQDPIIVGN